MYHIIGVQFHQICAGEDGAISEPAARKNSIKERKIMKYCSNCGKEVDDNAYVCPNCGCKIDGQKSGGSLSTLSIVGFIFAFVFPVVGLILSIIAHNNAKRDGDEKSRGFSKAGIIISACLIAFIVIIYIGVFACAIAAASAI